MVVQKNPYTSRIMVLSDTFTGIHIWTTRNNQWDIMKKLLLFLVITMALAGCEKEPDILPDWKCVTIVRTINHPIYPNGTIYSQRITVLEATSNTGAMTYELENTASNLYYTSSTVCTPLN